MSYYTYLRGMNDFFLRGDLSHSHNNHRSLLQRFGGITVGSPEKDVLYGKPRYDYSGGKGLHTSIS